MPISRSMGSAKGDPDLTHLKREYGIEDYPPVWNVMEHSPFGIVTLFYEGLDAPIKQKVANAFFIQPNAFLGVLMALKSARNVCAHHSRFWNKHIQSRITLNLGVRRELNGSSKFLVERRRLSSYAKFRPNRRGAASGDLLRKLGFASGNLIASRQAHSNAAI